MSRFWIFGFYTGNQFPSEYDGGALSWYFTARGTGPGGPRRDGYEVAFVPFENGKPAGTLQHFVTGWMTSPSSKNMWGRPVAVMQMQDGSLLITDDGGKRIWRVTYGKNAAKISVRHSRWLR